MAMMRERNRAGGWRGGRRAGLGFAAVAAAVGLACGGCTRSIITERVDTGYQPGDASSEMSYWFGLPGRTAVANDEALHGLFIIAEGEDRSGNYETRVARAKELGWLPANWDEPAETAVQRGIVARALVRILEIDGGVMMRLTGGSSRYALRELVFRNIIPPSSENQTFTGLDFIGVISKAQDYQNLRQRAARAEGGAGGEG